MDLQLAVDPYKRRVLFESMDWLLKTQKVSWHISANQISTKHSPTAVVWYTDLYTLDRKRSRGVASPDCPGGQSWWASRWRVSANCALARTGGCLRGDVPPSEAGRFWNFDTEFTQFSDNFYAKFIPFLPPFPLPLFFPFPLSSLLFSFPFLFLFFFPFSFSFSLSFSLSLSSSFPFLFLSLFFLSFPPFSPSRFLLSFPIFGVRGGQSAPSAPPLATPLKRSQRLGSSLWSHRKLPISHFNVHVPKTFRVDVKSYATCRALFPFCGQQ